MDIFKTLCVISVSMCKFGKGERKKRMDGVISHTCKLGSSTGVCSTRNGKRNAKEGEREKV